MALWSELIGFGLAIALSPLHIALLLLLLLGPRPLQRGGWLVGLWLVTSMLTPALLVSLGHGLLLSMEKGTGHRTGLDLLAAGALLALGFNALVQPAEEGSVPGWSRRLDDFAAQPLAGLLLISTALQLAVPDDLFLYAKASATLLEAAPGRGQELMAIVLFGLCCSLLLLVPLLAWLLLGGERVVPLLRSGQQWLYRRGDLLAGLISISLAIYLGWQGIEGLRSGVAG
jgi:hypothetical protein